MCLWVVHRTTLSLPPQGICATRGVVCSYLIQGDWRNTGMCGSGFSPFSRRNRCKCERLVATLYCSRLPIQVQLVSYHKPWGEVRKTLIMMTLLVSRRLGCGKRYERLLSTIYSYERCSPFLFSPFLCSHRYCSSHFSADVVRNG